MINGGAKYLFHGNVVNSEEQILLKDFLKLFHGTGPYGLILFLYKLIDFDVEHGVTANTFFLKRSLKKIANILILC